MHPAFMYWWKHQRRAAEWAERAGCGPSAEAWRPFEWRAGGEPFGGSSGTAFGVRRPLRFLAYKLDLDERQVSELSRILADLKTERAQAEVDHRRTVNAFADAVSGETFDEPGAGEGAALRVRSAERLREAVVRALRKIHALLDPEQREKLGYLIRTGVVSL